MNRILTLFYLHLVLILTPSSLNLSIFTQSPHWYVIWLICVKFLYSQFIVMEFVFLLYRTKLCTWKASTNFKITITEILSSYSHKPLASSMKQRKWSWPVTVFGNPTLVAKKNAVMCARENFTFKVGDPPIGITINCEELEHPIEGRFPSL